MNQKVGDNYSEWIIMHNIFFEAEESYESLKALAKDIGINNSHSSFCKVCNFCVESGIFFNVRNIGLNTIFEINFNSLRKHLRDCEPFLKFGKFVEKTVNLHNY